MLILIPFILIILIIYSIDAIYYSDVKPNNIDVEKKIVKEDNKTDIRKNYLDKYLQK